MTGPGAGVAGRLSLFFPHRASRLERNSRRNQELERGEKPKGMWWEGMSVKGTNPLHPPVFRRLAPFP